MRKPRMPLGGILAVLLLTSCGSSNPEHDPVKTSTRFVAANDAGISVVGRTAKIENGGLRFGYPGVTLSSHFRGKSLGLKAYSTTGDNALTVYVNDEPARIVTLTQQSQTIPLITSDELADYYVRLVHRNESWQGLVTVEGFELEAGELDRPDHLAKKKLLIVGDSVTCGDAVLREPVCAKNSRWWDAEKSYGMLLANVLDAEVHLVCHGGRGLIRSWNNRRDEHNAPDFFDLALSNENTPIAWDHDIYQPDLVLVSIGTNDFNLGIGALPEREEYVEAYVNFIQKIRAAHPQSTIVLTEGAMVNDAADPARPQKNVLVEYLAETVRRADDSRVLSVPSTHYPGDDCDAHPTGPQHAAMTDDLAPLLREIMNW